MVRCKLNELMGKQRKKVADVARETGINRNTITSFYYDKAQGINYATLNKLCKALNCQVQDLLEYVPSDPE